MFLHVFALINPKLNVFNPQMTLNKEVSRKLKFFFKNLIKRWILKVSRVVEEEEEETYADVNEKSQSWDLERQAGYEHVLYERRCRHQVFKLQVEYPLKALDAERSQFGEFAEESAEVVRLALRFAVVRYMIAQAVNYFEL